MTHEPYDFTIRGLRRHEVERMKKMRGYEIVDVETNDGVSYTIYVRRRW